MGTHRRSFHDGAAGTPVVRGWSPAPGAVCVQGFTTRPWLFPLRGHIPGGSRQREPPCPGTAKVNIEGAPFVYKRVHEPPGSPGCCWGKKTAEEGAQVQAWGLLSSAPERTQHLPGAAARRLPQSRLRTAVLTAQTWVWRQRSLEATAQASCHISCISLPELL